MMGRRVADGGIGIGPAPGQNRGAVNNEVARLAHPHPEASPYQQHKQHLARRGARRAQALGLLRLARNSCLPVSSQRQTTS
jgi:hypothetical protein